MTAALIANTFAAGPLGAGASNTGPGCVWGVYTFTKANAGDWIILADFTQVHFVIGTNAGDQDENSDIDGSVLNKVTFNGATTGETLVFAVGTPAAAT